MKRLLIIAVALCGIGISANAQTEKKDTLILSPRDSLIFQYADFIAEMSAYQHPRFKLYKTDNIYNLIKLDTATGRLWQVQYGMNKSADRMQVAIDDTSLVWDEDNLRAGRYELYPTNNTYTFILLDTERGYTYQVQWNTDPDKRFRIPIY